MSARITPRPRTADNFAGALELAFEGKAHLVARLTLEHKRPPDTWREFQTLDVTQTEESPCAPDELVEACVGFIRQEQDAGGPAEFKIVAYDTKGGTLLTLRMGPEVPATADQRATAESNALVSALVESNRRSHEQHKEYIELLKTSMAVPAAVSEMVKAMPEAMGKTAEHYKFLTDALRYHYFDRDEERASKERIENDKARFGTLEKAAAKLEPLAMAWLFKIMKDSGFDPSTIDPSLFGTGAGAAPSSGGAPAGASVIQLSRKVEALRTFCKSLTNDEKVKLIDACDDEGDALSLLFGASNAPDDRSCDACLKELRDRLKAKGRDLLWVIRTLGPIVGDRAAPLIPILKPIWEAT